MFLCQTRISLWNEVNSVNKLCFALQQKLRHLFVAASVRPAQLYYFAQILLIWL